MRVFALILFTFISFVGVLEPASLAAGMEQIVLPAVDTSVGKPLMRVFSERKSVRSYRDENLQLDTLSGLLWSAFGVNRPDTGKRTAPSARNMQEIDIYVSMENGLYLYNADRHVLEPVLEKDIRAVTGKQDFVSEAPVNLIFVADLSKMDTMGDKKDFYAAVDTGYISQNVYLYCASKDLATVARGWFDEKALRKAMGLGPGKKIILTQTVGYPAE